MRGTRRLLCTPDHSRPKLYQSSGVSLQCLSRRPTLPTRRQQADPHPVSLAQAYQARRLLQGANPQCALRASFSAHALLLSSRPCFPHIAERQQLRLKLCRLPPWHTPSLPHLLLTLSSTCCRSSTTRCTVRSPAMVGACPASPASAAWLASATRCAMWLSRHASAASTGANSSEASAILQEAVSAGTWAS